MTDHPLGLETVMWFGTSWGARVCRAENHIETPVGVRCQCGQRIEHDDFGVRILHIGGDQHADDDIGYSYFHHNCFMTNILGPDWRNTMPPLP